MARHRNIRNQNYDDYDEVDEYGKSYDDTDTYGVSPGTAAQFMYRRDDSSKSLNRFPSLPEGDGPAEDDAMDESGLSSYLRRGASHLGPDQVDEGRLQSCIDYIENCTGDVFTRTQLREAVIAANYNAELALQYLLNDENTDKPAMSTKPPIHQLSKNLENLTVENDTVNFSAGVTRVESPVKKKAKVYGSGSGRIIVPSDPTVVNSMSTAKAVRKEVKLPDWITGFVNDANQYYSDAAEELQGRLPLKPNHGPSQNLVSVSHDNTGKAFPRIESTPNLKVFDISTTPNPTSPKSSRKNSNTPNSGDHRSQTSTPSTGSPKSHRKNIKGLPRVESQTELPAFASKTPEISNKSAAKTTALYEQRQNATKPLLNLIVIGHVDAGKSTLIGHLLFLLGKVDAKQMQKFEHEAKKMGKSSFMYAWVLDETGEERSRGVTIDIAQTSFETANRSVNLMDAPGHRDFIPNMITGTATSDVALLVVDATRGEFETGFQSGGQTREHTLLARSLGVTQVVVVVNKMDTVDWSEERYSSIVSTLTPFLKATGYKDGDVSFVPCSGFSGDNLVTSPKAKGAGWWSGPTLLERIDNFRPPTRQIDKPFRQIISDVFKSISGGFAVAGKIEAGHVEVGDKVLLMPSATTGTVKSITLDAESHNICFAGDNAILGLTGIDQTDVHIGDIICDPSSPVAVTTRLRGRIALFTPKVPLLAGQECVFHNQSFTESCVVKKLLTQINRNTGEVQKRNPRVLVKNSSGEIELLLQRPVCAELYSASKELGKFLLRDSGTTIAAGVITEIFG